MESAMSEMFINEIQNFEMEYIEGLIKTFPGLQCFPKVNVVCRADVYPGPLYNKVAVISGGRSGHEPAHAGFVGEGMLTAAICGNLLESPTVDAILDGIRAVTGFMGCLLIVMNYERDRLNFGLAAEQAKYEGYQVETVIVGDDCGLPQPLGLSRRRGLAGTILVHKVAGAAAAAGLSLADVAREARNASKNVGTVSVGLWTSPGVATKKMKLGGGMYSDCEGVLREDAPPPNILVSLILKKILSKEETNHDPITRGDRVVMMVNGLGRTSLSELTIATRNTISTLTNDHGLTVDRVYTGSFMTSPNMEGLSISLMKVDLPSMTILQRLDAETKAPYWPIGVSGAIPENDPPSPLLNTIQAHTRPQQLTEQGELLEAAIKSAALALIDSRDVLNKWDSKVGDGDCGSNMWNGAQQILRELESYPLNDAAETVHAIRHSIKNFMGVTSGTIYSIFCMAACVSLKTSFNSGVISISQQWTEALAAGIEAVRKYGGAGAHDGTMLDALIPALSSLKEKLNAGDDPSTAFFRSVDDAFLAASSTKHMKATAGRTPVSLEDSSGPDPGAMAAAIWYKNAAMAVRKKVNRI